VDLQIQDHVVIVTGASRGLGRASIEALLGEGVRVVAAARSADALAELEAAHPGRVVAATADMADVEAVEALVPLAIEEFGRIDAVVNNAGVAPAGNFLEATAESMLDVFRVNVVAPGLLARAAARWWIDEGRGGKVVNVSSISGERGKATLAAYSSSKGALNQLTKALAAEWARHDIQVNAIAPGAFATEAQRRVLDDEEMNRRRIRKVPAGRWAAPGEIGPLVCYLVSPASRFMTGAVVTIDGGEVARI
jgi:2-deoxy-D-gluconate 3-dehydrogenase